MSFHVGQRVWFLTTHDGTKPWLIGERTWRSGKIERETTEEVWQGPCVLVLLDDSYEFWAIPAEIRTEEEHAAWCLAL